jgi:hypothetical protein
MSVRAGAANGGTVPQRDLALDALDSGNKVLFVLDVQ